MAEFLGCVPETIATLLISYIPTENKNLNKKERKYLPYSTDTFIYSNSMNGMPVTS